MQTKKKLRPFVKIHGGKFYLAPWVVENFPKGYEEMRYLEPYCGAASVFLNKAASKEETLNDINEGIVKILWALRDEAPEFIGRLKRIKYCEESFERAKKKLDKSEDYMSYAVAEFVIRRMSRGGLKEAFAWSERKRGGQPGDVNAWETIIEQLPLIAERLKETFIFNKPAIEVIKAYNNKETLVYCDPPYLPSTRTAKEAYEFEMTEDEHIELSEVLNVFKGKVIISGYYSALYKDLYDGWTCKKKKISNHSGQNKTKGSRIECLWFNY